ncbi:START domain-containing protein [Aquipseudomonas campi]|uniref:START domain-containing protein n=1 Tax=Aquipseudomonas campi TaxID=2731681 RepID=A0A6M8FE89_9GAMM|nr:START domain-containing protein [Pseudomonas campi]QKE63157.1 START domain-containing protein [Pseudomonas campi]
MKGLTRVAAFCGLGILAASGLTRAEDWQLVKDEEGIRVYLSAVEGSKYKAYRGVTTIKSDVARLRALQDDVQGSCPWIHACAGQMLLKHEGMESWVYTRFEMPWPVTARDSILRVVTQVNADGSLVRLMDGQPQYLPEDKAYVRVASLKGSWTFMPKAAGEVEVTYQVHTEPGGSVPSWLANSFVVDAPFNTLQGLRAKAEGR